MKKNAYRTGIITLTALLAAALVTLAMERPFKKTTVISIKKPVAVKTVVKPIVYDTALLTRMMTAAHELDFNKRQCTYGGMIDMNDPNDTTNNVRQLKFSFSRSGDNYYYQVGPAEIIHQDQLNVYVQNDQRKVVLSNHAITIKPPISDLGILEKAMESEHYTLQTTVSGQSQTLALVNEQHISCKEFAITLDTVSGKLQRIYMRTTDFGSPQDKQLDRTLDVHITRLENVSDMRQYPSANDIVRKSGSKWLLQGKYRDYELIML
jgi:hypothetical protein